MAMRRILIFVLLLMQTMLFADFLEIESPEKTTPRKIVLPSTIGKADFAKKAVFWRIYLGSTAYPFYYQDEEGIPLDRFFSPTELSALNKEDCASVKFKSRDLPLVGFSCQFGDSAYFRSSEKNILDIVIKTRLGEILFCYDIAQDLFFEKSDGTPYTPPPKDEVAENLFRIRLLEKYGLCDTSEKEKLPIGIAGLRATDVKNLRGNELTRLVEEKRAVVRNQVWEALKREPLKAPIDQKSSLSGNINDGECETQAEQRGTVKYVSWVIVLTCTAGFFLWLKIRSHRRRTK